MIRVLVVLLIFQTHIGFSQEVSRNYNLDFTEIVGDLPVGWRIVEGKNSEITIDTVEKSRGNPSVKITNFSEDAMEAGVLLFDVPDNYDGESLIFAAEIKTENVDSLGHAGILCKILPDVDAKNLADVELNGDNDWHTHFLTMELRPKDTDKIQLGVYLAGKGTAWFSNMHLLIDEKDYREGKLLDLGEDSIYVRQSHIPPFELNNELDDRIKILGQTWGLVKYFHPNVARGDHDMDIELFKIFPKVLDSRSEREFEDVICNWIDSLGDISGYPRGDFSYVDSLRVQGNYNWIDQLNSRLKSKLSHLIEIRTPEKHHYFDYAIAGNATFCEFTYPNAAVDDFGFRMLGLFRYWNIINYFSPYIYLAEQPWEQVLENSIREFYNATDAKSLDFAYLRLFAKINDGHGFSKLSTSSNTIIFGDRILDLKARIIDGKAIITENNLEERSELQVGDIIEEIDGIEISERLSELRELVPASNEKYANRLVEELLFRTNEKKINIGIGTSHANELETAMLRTRGLYEMQSTNSQDDNVPSFYVIRDSIGYFNAGSFDESDTTEFWNLVKNTKGLVLDYRPYPKHYIDRFLSTKLFSNESAFVDFTGNQGYRPGEFGSIELGKIGVANEDYYRGKVVILVDEKTMSNGEFQTMGLRRSPNARVLGENTAGADGNISWVDLPFGYSTAFSAIGVYGPNGEEMQGVGVVPDIQITPTLEHIINKEDILLDRAIEIILSEQ